MLPPRPASPGDLAVLSLWNVSMCLVPLSCPREQPYSAASSSLLLEVNLVINTVYAGKAYYLPQALATCLHKHPLCFLVLVFLLSQFLFSLKLGSVARLTQFTVFNNALSCLPLVH